MSVASIQARARELVARCTAEVHLPADYPALRRIFEDGNATTEQMLDALERRDALAARLLALAEAPLHNVAPLAWSLPRLVNQLGTQRVLDLSLALLLADAFGRIPASLARCDFWPTAVRGALIGRAIAGACGRPERDRLFCAGLLLPTGLALMWHANPRAMGRVREAQLDGPQPPLAQQRKLLATDQVAVAAALARHWQLPAPIQRALACCDEPARAVPHHFDAAVLKLAMGCTQAAGTTPEPDPLSLDLLRLDPVELANITRAADALLPRYLEIIPRRTYPPSVASAPDPDAPAAR